MALSNERLREKYEKAVNALTTLKEAVQDITSVKTSAPGAHKEPEKLYRVYRDSMIQRFEYTFDVTWKLLSEYLVSQGRTTEIKAPKAIFRESLKAGILSEEETRLAINMVEDRNLTTHGYDEALIEEISARIPSYAVLLEKVVQQAK